MILYVNGDSHCVGHGIMEEYGMTHEDIRYSRIRQAPHPANFEYSFGFQIAQKLNLPLVCQAASGSSIERVLRTTRQFVYQTNQKIFVLLGLPAVNREEWYFQNKWWQITEGNQERYPAELHSRFQSWLVEYDTQKYLINRTKTILGQIQKLDSWLHSKQIPHLFFSTYDELTGYENYTEYLQSAGIKPDKWNHFKLDGHTAWANYLTKKIDDIICKR